MYMGWCFQIWLKRKDKRQHLKKKSVDSAFFHSANDCIKQSTIVPSYSPWSVTCNDGFVPHALTHASEAQQSSNSAKKGKKRDIRKLGVNFKNDPAAYRQKEHILLNLLFHFMD